MVTEDDRGARAMEQAITRAPSGQHLVTRARAMDEAMKFVGTRQLDAVLLDYDLPGEGALRHCLRLKEANSNLPVLVFSPRADRARAAETLTAGADDLLAVEECSPEYLNRALRYAVDRARSLRDLALSESLMQAILRNLDEGVIVADRNERLLLVNPAARNLLGIGSIAGLPTDIFGMFEADTVTRIRDRERPMARAIRGETVTDLEIFHRNANAPQGRFLSVNAGPMLDEMGNIVGGIVSFRDVTDRKKVEDELSHLSLHDGLTGLPNRSFFLETLRKAVARARRSGSRLAVLLMDLDHFKQINDRLGHELGDMLLVEVARRLSDGLRAGDFVARLGGDEFVVLFENFGHEERAAGLADKIVELLSPTFRIEGHDVAVTVSIGISTFPECGDDAGSLMKTGDVAMYRAKEGGRNTYHFYSRSVHAEMSRRAMLEAGLRDAIRNDEFELEFQPVANLASGEIVALEALLRWHHPDQGLIRPLEFIPILETMGLMGRVGEWVIASACAQLREWQTALGRPELTVSVNISPHQLIHRRIADVIQRVLTNASLDPGHLTLEINESALLEHPRSTREHLSLLAAQGFRIALDDFGTGYASLQAIRQLPLSYLKIDRSLVMSLPTDPEDVAVVDAGLRFAEALGIECIAEGLEVQEQLDFLASRGCPLGQGYLISPPLPVGAVGEFFGRDWRAA